MGAEQQKYTESPGGEAGGILPLEGCRRESRMKFFLPVVTASNELIDRLLS